MIRPIDLEKLTKPICVTWKKNLVTGLEDAVLISDTDNALEELSEEGSTVFTFECKNSTSFKNILELGGYTVSKNKKCVSTVVTVEDLPQKIFECIWGCNTNEEIESDNEGAYTNEENESDNEGAYTNEENESCDTAYSDKESDKINMSYDNCYNSDIIVDLRSLEKKNDEVQIHTNKKQPDDRLNYDGDFSSTKIEIINCSSPSNSIIDCETEEDETLCAEGCKCVNCIEEGESDL